MKLFSRTAAAAAVAAPLTLASLTGTVTPAQAAPRAPAQAPAPAFDMKADCPALPAGADPTTWECLVMVVAAGTLKLGGLTQQITSPIKIIVQSGPPEGGGPNELKQVEMDAAPMKIPGGVLGLLGLPTAPWLEDLPGFKVEVESRYAGGFALALPSANVNMRVRIINLLLGDKCFIGTEGDPIKFSLLADMSTLKVVQQPDPADPLGTPFILGVDVGDKTFTVPKSDCGLLGGVIDWKAGLPSPAGKNEAAFETFMGIGTYAGGAGAGTTPAPAPDPATLRFG